MSNHLKQLFQLILTITVGQGEMNKENSDVISPGLDHQSLDSLLEEMKTVFDDFLLKQQGIALLTKHRYPLYHGAFPILGLNNMIITEPAGKRLGLATVFDTERTGIHLDQAYNVRRNMADIFSYLVKISRRSFQVTGIGNRQVELAANACPIANIVE